MAAYLKIANVTGEAADKNHKGWIDLESFHTGVHRHQQMGAQGAQRHNTGIAQLEPIHMTKMLDKATVKLFEFACDGKVHDEVTMHYMISLGASQREVGLEIKLIHASITQHDLTISGAEGVTPTENLVCSFQEIEYSYKVWGRDGGSQGDITASWKAEEGER